MADNDQYNDEYTFEDPDAISSELTDDGESVEDRPSKYAMPSGGNKNKTLRNALIAVFLFIMAMLAYKLISAIFSSKKQLAKTHVVSESHIKTTNESLPLSEMALPTVDVPVNTVTNVADDSKLNQKISVVEQSQQNLVSEVGVINNQVTGVNTNVNAIMAQMAALNQLIEQLSVKVAEQSQMIERLTPRIMPKKRQSKSRALMNPVPKYYLQAVIPGRAWLIATNGATLTVREGTLIAGYGVVKLIDPIQGRVMINSGQVIRFSQNDS